MVPKILDYEDGRIVVTANAALIPEIKNIIDKYPNPEPYLAYVHLMTAPDSPYINLEDDEKGDTVIYDIIQTLGDFDSDDELLELALDRFKQFYSSTAKNYYDSLKISIDKMAKYLRDEPIVSGRDGNLSEIIRIHKEGATNIRNFKDIEKQVDEELKTKMRGKSNLGEY